MAGGLFLAYLGLRTLLAEPAPQATIQSTPQTTRQDATGSGRSLLAAYASTFLLTLTNPLTILSFAAVFAGLGAASTGATQARSALLVLGDFLGSSLWWLTLSAGSTVSPASSSSPSAWRPWSEA